MKEEGLSQAADLQRTNTEGRSTAAENLKFMRAAIERTDRQFKPEPHVIIVWGLICMILYSSVHFLLKSDMQKWILPLYLALIAVGLGYTFSSLKRVDRRQKSAGYIPQIPRQVTGIWLIVTPHILTWSILGMLLNDYSAGDPAFLAAMGLSIALAATGILYSREWLYGGAGIFAGMFLTYFARDYGYLILGLATGAGCIVPAIICQRNFNRRERENE